MKASHTLFRILGVFVAAVATTGFLWAQTVEISPASNTLPRGGTVSLNVNINNVTNLLASHVKVTFDNTKLHYDGASNGTFMPAGAFFGQSVYLNEVSVDQSVLANPPANGSGLLFTISFTALEAVSASGVTLAVDLRDPSNVSIPAGTTGSTVTVENPLPHVTDISPATKTSGDLTFDLTVNGSNFVPTSVVWFKGVARATAYGSASTLTATIPAADIVLAGLFPITVVNPAPGGGTSVEVVDLQIVSGNAANITLTSGNTQSAKINTALANPFVVTVTDAGGNPVSGTSVGFAVTAFPAGATGQSLSVTTMPTDVNGQAASTLTTGSKIGNYTVDATSTGLSGNPVTFTATATVGDAATIEMTSGDGQTAPISTLLSPFVVTVKDAGGNLVSGTTVGFSIVTSPAGSAGQGLSTAAMATDVNGQASTMLTLGNKGGTYTVSAASGTLGGSPVTFTATATFGTATTITMTSGDGQSAVINTALTNPFVVTVTDAGGNPVPGTSVAFSIFSTPASAGGQGLSAGTVLTDVNGQASSTLTLGSKVGSYAVRASSGTLINSPIEFTATATVGTATTIALTSGDGQTAAINTALTNPFVVTVTDAGGNPVPGTSVAFSIFSTPALAAGQSLSAGTVLTDVNGQASGTLTLGNKVGEYSVTASSAGLGGSPVSFTATATAGALHHFDIGAIGPQTSGTSFDMLITAQDIGNNTVPGFAGTVALTINTGSIAPTTSESFAGGLLTQPVTVSGNGTGKIITVDDLAGHTGTSNAFDVQTMPNLFVSANPQVAAAGIVYPNDAWTATAYEANDWSFVGNPTVSFYIVPEPGMTFNTSTVTLTWDATVLGFAAVNFGSQGTPNGIVGSGQSYTHTESFNQSLGANTVTVVATRTGGSDFPAISAGDYIARVDFHLLKPGYSAVNVQGASFQRMPSSTVQVASHPGAVKAYLGDVASAGATGNTTGDGVIDFQDLAPWSVSYWSGVPGYEGGLTNYKVKYDFGPTANGSAFSLPAVDTKVDFEDLVIFSIAYGLSSTHQLPKAAPPSQEPMLVSLGQPSVNGTETRIGVMVGGAVSDLRAMRIELKGQFGSFLGVEKGSLLQEYSSPVMLLSRSEEGKVFVDLAVMGLDARGLNRAGEVAVLRFAGTPHVQLTYNEARTSGNQTMSVLKVKGAGEAVPTSYGLKQNYPNPFNPTTTIEFEVPATGDVTLEVYNMLGQRVATLVQEMKEAGFYQVQWNGKDMDQRTVASGIFFYRLQAGQFTEVKKMLLLK